MALELATQASDEAAAFAVLSDACQSRETSPALLERALESRRRLRSGRVVRALVADLVAGSCSVLERGYLHHVQRPHGLPRGELQAEGSTHGKRAVRDVLLADLGVAIELDGRAFHDTASSRDADHERDLAAAAGSDLLTIRLTYGQVFSTPCRTAGLMHALLVRRGWDGSLGTCDRCAGS